MSNCYAEVVNNIFVSLIHSISWHLYLCSCLIFEKLCEKLIDAIRVLEHTYIPLKMCFSKMTGGQWLQTGCIITLVAQLQGTQDRHAQKPSPLLRPTKEISAMARNLFFSERAKFICQPASWYTFGLPGLVFSPFLCQKIARKNCNFSQGTMCSMQMKADSPGVNHLTCHWAKQSFWS